MKKLGLLLGSFDPIHIAHINIAACAINSGLCDKVLFVVAKHNPWKKNEPTSFDLRCKMVEVGIEPLGDKSEVCRLEEGIESPTYSYKVISLIREQYPEDELYLLAGSDTIDKIPNWKNFETHIKDKIGFIEVLRGHESLIANEPIPFKIQCEAVSTCMKVTVLETQKMNVSSTLVRKMVHDGMNPYPYVTKEVLQIINENNLYRNG